MNGGNGSKTGQLKRTIRRGLTQSVWMHLCCVTLAGVVLVMATVVEANAKVRRHALVVGANRGNASETPLKYAERDARRIARILREHGGFEAQNVRLRTAPTVAEVQSELRRLERQVRAHPHDDSVLLVYYSGHADAEAMHLDGGLLPLATVKKVALHSRAKVRVLVIDACRSGAVTRVKGGRRGPAFKVQIDNRLRTRGVAILTSSAAGEMSHESDQIGASFFTHYLASALLGAADRNGDDRVTIDEAFAYASARTLAATARTLAGPQHPTFELNLGGREALVLTRPTANRAHGVLVLSDPGNYVIQRRTRLDVVAEVSAPTGARRMGLRPGRYIITRNTPAAVFRAEAEVRPGQVVAVRRADMRAVLTSSTAAKGAARTLYLRAGGGGRGGVLDLGSAPMAMVGVGWQPGRAALEISGQFGLASASLEGVRVGTTEVGVTASAGWTWQRSAWRVTAMAGIGPTWLLQSFGGVQLADRASLALRVDAGVRISRALGATTQLQLSPSMIGYLLSASDGTATSTGTHFAPALVLALTKRI